MNLITTTNPRPHKPAFGLLLLVVLAVVLLFTSCNPRAWCQRNYPPQLLRETVVRDTTIYLQGATVHDTLFKLYELYTGGVRLIKDSSDRVELTTMRDKYNRLLITCRAKPDTLRVPKIIHTTDTQFITKEIPVTPQWVWNAVGAILFVLVFLFAYFFGSKIA